MKRFLIFALLGPVLGFLVMFTVVSFITAGPMVFSSVAILFSSHGALIWIFGIPVAFVLGAIPMMFAYATDAALAKHPKVVRLMATTLAAYCIFVVMLLLPGTSDAVLTVLTLGLVAAIPAAVCSWLSSEKQNGSEV